MDTPKGARKRVLLINYYWPPCGDVGVLRTLKFAKYLREFGWEPVIFTAQNAHYPRLDYTNEKDIPADLEIIRQSIIEPHGLYKRIMGKGKPGQEAVLLSESKSSSFAKLAVWARANFFIPDARALWIRPSVKKLKRYLKKHPVDAILSSGPPQTNTRIATILHKSTGIPWLADWRDPWTQVDYYDSLPLTSFADRLHKKWEAEALQYASKTLIVSKHWAADLKQIGAHNVEVLTNGFDPDDYTQLKPVKSHHFTLTHLGILGTDRIPRGLIQACGELVKTNADFNAALKLRLVGQVTSAFKTQAYAAGLKDEHLDIIGNQARTKALELAAGSSLTLLVLNQQANAAGRIPFKLFEYLALGRPILGFGPIPSDVNDILKATRAGELLAVNDVDRIKQLLAAYFAQYQNGTLASGLASANIAPYHFRTLTQRLAGYLDEIVS